MTLLPAGVRRVLVAGSTGAGKTTMARALSAARGLPHTEMDELWHGPDWEPRAEFAAGRAGAPNRRLGSTRLRGPG